MSIQTQQPQTQQPVVVYPNSVSGQASPSRSQSDGSFGTVFIVLAVIIVISAIACFLGRLCHRRMSRTTKPSKRKQNHNFRPKERDIEFGSDGRIPTAKPAGHGDPSKGFNFEMLGNGDPGEFRIPEHGYPAGFRMPGNGDPIGFRMPEEHGDPAGFRMPGNEDPIGFRMHQEHGDPAGFRMPGNDDPTGFRMPGHGDIKGEAKPVDDEALEAAAWYGSK